MSYQPIYTPEELTEIDRLQAIVMQKEEELRAAQTANERIDRFRALMAALKELNNALDKRIATKQS